MNPSVGGLYVCMIYVCVAYNVCACVRLSLMCTDIYVCMCMKVGCPSEYQNGCMYANVCAGTWLYVCVCVCISMSVRDCLHE